MIRRDPAGAASGDHDLVIVGGGIYGATLALEAARRGLRPLLVERGDFGGATSWHSLRIVHGGLRYLQSLDLHRFRESVGERRWFFREFPEQVRAMPCVMPLYGRGLRRPSVFRVALALNDLLSRRRNDGVRADRQLLGGRILSVAETTEMFPLVSSEGLRGAALWHDGSMPDSQRLLVEILRWAVAAGATALNYVEATGLLREGARVTGLAATDLVSNASLELRAPVVVNCAGPWCRELAARFDRDVPELFRPSLAFNALIDRTPERDVALAVSLDAGSGGTYFLHPWKGKLLIGTHHEGWSGSLEDGRIEDALVKRMLNDLNRAMPGLDLGPDDVLRIHWGFLPAREDGSHELAVRELIRHHGDAGGPEGLFTVSGVKYTTARLVAEKTLRRVAAWRGQPLAAVGSTPRPAPVEPPSSSAIERLLEDEPDAAAERIVALARDEAVVHLDDLMLRRTDWAVDPRLGRKLGTKIALALGWDAERAREEVGRLEVGSDSVPGGATH